MKLESQVHSTQYPPPSFCFWADHYQHVFHSKNGTQMHYCGPLGLFFPISHKALFYYGT